MNDLGISLAWMALQATLLCVTAAAIYFAARRRNTACASPVLCGALVMTIGIAALSFSPWPRWKIASNFVQPVRGAEAAAADAMRSESKMAPTAGGAADLAANEPGASARGASLDARLVDFWSRFWGDLQRRVEGSAREGKASSAWRWPAWLAVMMFLGVFIGAIRASLGLLALARLLCETRRVSDPSLEKLFGRLCSRLRCRRPIDLRELTDFKAGGLPAVIGWLRPTILLPADWRSWSDDARQGILAHEIAHVAHGDFLAGLVAQLGLVLHFYNPFVHWLARRLRLEQELAADACGAELAGGRKSYLAILATMALEHDNSQTFWAGRPFFPARGTLMRRIEMLNDPKFTARRSPSRLGPAVLLALLAFVGLAVSGLRGASDAAQAADPAVKQAAAEDAALQSSEAALPAFDESYLPADAIAVLSFKPLKIPGSNIVFEPEMMGFPGAFGFSFSPADKNEDGARTWELEEAKAVVLAPSQEGVAGSDSEASAEPPVIIIYRTRMPYEPSKLRKRVFGEMPDGVTEATRQGRRCFRAASEVTGDAVEFLLADDRTIIVARERDMSRACAVESSQHPNWYGKWQAIAGCPLALAFDPQAMAATEKGMAAEDIDPWATILQETSLVLGRVNSTTGSLEVSAAADCASPEEAQTIAELVQGALALAGRAMPQVLPVAELPEEFRSLDVVGSLAQILSQVKVNTQGMQVQVMGGFNAAFSAQVAVATRTILARQAEEMKANNVQAKQIEKQHMANLRRLAEAMNAYHDDHGHYPPAAIAGPDGKTLHSWRVELLPYLGERELFASYKLDEPWDSKHNKELVAKIPHVYSATNRFEQGHADYFVVTGQGMLFDRTAIASRESITAAAGKSILLVQGSYQHIPWTKPQDLDYSAQPMPRPFRGRGDGFYAAFVDGTVQYFPRNADPTAIRPLLTKAGGKEAKLR